MNLFQDINIAQTAEAIQKSGQIHENWKELSPLLSNDQRDEILKIFFRDLYRIKLEEMDTYDNLYIIVKVVMKNAVPRENGISDFVRNIVDMQDEGKLPTLLEDSDIDTLESDEAALLTELMKEIAFPQTDVYETGLTPIMAGFMKGWIVTVGQELTRDDRVIATALQTVQDLTIKSDGNYNVQDAA